jgi:ABC-type nitrate/sulfonate/bicarbonate transport system permease component
LESWVEGRQQEGRLRESYLVSTKRTSKGTIMEKVTLGFVIGFIVGVLVAILNFSL